MKKIILVSGIIIVGLVSFLFAAYWFSKKLAPGSYPYAEQYRVNCDEATLIKAIQDFKIENPQYNVPNKIGLMDGRKDSSDYWYHIYFYNAEDTQIIYVWARPINKNKTTLAFVGINEGMTLGNWKDVNKDFRPKENEEIKRKFEERILNNLKVDIEK